MIIFHKLSKYTIILIGGGRRYFDSRFYAQIYEKLGSEIISANKAIPPSVKTARLGMIKELVEFLENALPQIVSSVIGLFGIIIIIASLNMDVFYGSIIASFLIFLIYLFTSKRTTSLNGSYNDELEKQVDVISSNNKAELSLHLKRTMK